MCSPFPGMDPYLEHPALWPDVHNRLVAAIADAMSPVLRPRYYIALEQRTYLLTADEVHETFLEVREAAGHEVVAVLELLSPANKLLADGRREYEKKREVVFRTRTHLVEVDLLRAGEPMPMVIRERKGARGDFRSDYRILVSRGERRPRAQLYPFSLRDPIPSFPLPLLPEDPEPAVDLGGILHALYERASFDIRIDYSKDPVPRIAPQDESWAQELVSRREGAS